MNEDEIIKAIGKQKEGLQDLEDKLKKAKEEKEIPEPKKWCDFKDGGYHAFGYDTKLQDEVLNRKIHILQEIHKLRFTLGDQDYESTDYSVSNWLPMMIKSFVVMRMF